MNKKMTDPLESTTAVSVLSAHKYGSQWLAGWVILLGNVFLFASSLNCLFRWLSYGFAWDAAALVFSLTLALLVYFFAMERARIASLNGRLLFSVTALLVWAVFLPLVMRLAGLQ